MSLGMGIYVSARYVCFFYACLRVLERFDEGKKDDEKRKVSQSIEAIFLYNRVEYVPALSHYPIYGDKLQRDLTASPSRTSYSLNCICDPTPRKLSSSRLNRRKLS